MPAEKAVNFKLAGPATSVLALLQEVDLGYPDVQGKVEVHFPLDSGSPDDAPITAKLTVLVVAT